MGQRGPKAKSPTLKLLAGNPGRRPAEGAAPAGGRRIARGLPDRPPEVAGEAAAEWARIVPELDAAGILSRVDRAALAAYCLAWAELMTALDILNREGRTVREPIQSARGEVVGEKIKLHPAVRLQQSAFGRVRALLADLGLTPGARQRMEGGAAGGGELPANRILGLRDRAAAARNGGA
jgi:P27 family predicted phage terminase small subunit